MAARIPRIARLTLYSGPNCSLCDVAKAELAKVRQTHQFHLQVVNIQDKGQERWKKKYVYWIPALHLEGKEIAKGRWGATTVLDALKKWEATQFLGFTFEYNPTHEWETYPPQTFYYDRYTPVILGDTPKSSPDHDERDVRRCFNCGSPDHAVVSCPSPLDRQLISLSRQLFNFLHSDRTQRDPDRFHVVEAWKQQRLQWLDKFQPGQISGPSLRDALGLRDEDPGENVHWLRTISEWGYPRGWVSKYDPRDDVRQIIANGSSVEESFFEDDNYPFTIFGETDEELLLSSKVQPNSNESSIISDVDGPDNTSDSDTLSSEGEPTRWAQYPSSLFLSHLLPVYNGHLLPPLTTASSRGNSTFSSDRQALWEQITHTAGVDASYPGSHSIPPWRLPETFGSASSGQPPPPPSPPPPLPPVPPPPSLPPPPPTIDSSPTITSFSGVPLSQRATAVHSVGQSDDEVEVDMDMSDSD
ncbi:hypothetical protein BJ138DRAFT_1009977 [Hygrophoropsis aurantiaca]|uniref:Uncharacterized protein n=1 Tax=Hygrophoropsis aurantiaca TaxID=72124 RepID=A0ACB8AB17_9AGAM|nr:hypothetical protein BJ138DRAFT_1009977 [Hygrophoropsis aurantiaca]